MFGFFRSSSARLAPQDVVARHARGEMLVIDVRDIAEVRASGTAKGGLHIPLMRLAHFADPRHPDHLPQLTPEVPVALFCASGARSQMGCRILRQLGYAEVHNLGGLGDWQRGGGQIARQG